MKDQPRRGEGGQKKTGELVGELGKTLGKIWEKNLEESSAGHSPRSWWVLDLRMSMALDGFWMLRLFVVGCLVVVDQSRRSCPSLQRGWHLLAIILRGAEYNNVW
jgi:hypothetical protein